MVCDLQVHGLESRLWSGSRLWTLVYGPGSRLLTGVLSLDSRRLSLEAVGAGFCVQSSLFLRGVPVHTLECEPFCKSECEPFCKSDCFSRNQVEGFHSARLDTSPSEVGGNETFALRRVNVSTHSSLILGILHPT